MKKRLLVLASIFTAALFLLATLTTIFSPKAYAVNDPVGACRAILAEATHHDIKDIDASHPFIQTCIKKGYPAGYNNPTNNNDSAACPTTDAYQTYCQAGFKKGQADAKAESGTSTPSASTIKTAAEKACKPYQDQKGLSDDDQVANFKACVVGYTGQYAGKDVSTSCRSYSGARLAACIKGHDAAADPKHKTIVPGTASTSAPAAGTTGTNTGTVDNTNAEKQLGCNFSASPLSWFICPMVNLLVDAIEAIDSLITDQLTIETNDIFCEQGDTCQAYYAAWQSFRNIALGLMVVAGLIILISQALGVELLDPYMVRKTLPRLLVAALAITLSWPLMQYAVTLSNDLGLGIRHLIYAPFTQLSDSIDLSFGGSFSSLFFGGAATVGTAVAAVPVWIAFGGIGVMLAYAGTAMLAVLIAIIILILRQVAIILMIIMAPIAIVAYILPNTQRFYKLWWESFSKALLMFPLIAAFIASGRVFSAVAINNGGVLNGIIGFCAYFAPYFLIPLTFKFAGGALRQIGGFVNDRSRGGFDGLRQFRRNQTKERVQRARNKGLYRSDLGKFTRPFARDAVGNRKSTSVGNLLNTIGNYSLDADEMVPLKLGTTTLKGLKQKPGIPGFRRGAKRDVARINQSKREQTTKAAQEIDPGYKAGRLLAGEFGYYTSGLAPEAIGQLADNYGVFNRDGSFSHFRAPDSLAEREQVASIMATSSSQEAREAAAELIPAARLMEKYPMSAETSRVDGRFLGLQAAARAGRLEIDDVVGNHNRLIASGVEAEEATKETTMLQDLLTPKRVSAARGHGIAYNEDGTAYNVYKEHPTDPTRSGPFSDKAADSLARISSPELAQIKSEDLDNEMGEAWVANASEHEMEWATDPADGTRKVMPKLAPDGSKIPKKNTDPLQAQRAEEIQKRLKYIAQYSQGDSDVGRKLRGIWQRIGRDESELSWGSGSPEDIRRAQGAQEQKPDQNQQP